MLLDGILMLDTSSAQNFSILSGDTLPPGGQTVGELFYKTGTNSGLYAYTGTLWVEVADTATMQAKFDAKVSKAGDVMSGNLNMSNNTVTGLKNPVSSTDAASKSYVDGLVAGLTWKNSVKVATTTNITLSGLQTIDGIAVLESDRVLVKNQTTGSQNGIYIVSPGAWIRSSDMDSTTPVNEVNGAGTWVEQGATQGDTGWTVISNVATLGTDNITWAQFNGASGITAGAGLIKSGNTLSIALGAGIAELPSNEVGVDVYASGGLMTTLDGINSSSGATAQLSLTRTGVTASTYKSVTTDVYGRITGGTNPTTLAGFGISDAAPLSHTTDYSLHLTSAQNTWLDAIIATSAEVNYLNGVTSNVQTQLNGKQPADGDLTSIAALAGTSGLLRKTAADTWSLDTSAYLTTNQNITLTGDATGSGSTSIAVTLATIAQSTGSSFVKISLDTKGRVIGNTAVSFTDITNVLGFTPVSVSGAGALGTWGISVTGSAGSSEFARSVPLGTVSGTWLYSADSGKCVVATSTTNVPANTFSAGNIISIFNDSASPITIAQGASLTLRQVATTNVGNRTLAAYGLATIWFVSPTVAVISGAGVS